MDTYDALAKARGDGQRVALVTVLAVEGDAPSHPGAKLVVGGHGVLAGTLGCSEFDTAGLEEATAQSLPGRMRALTERGIAETQVEHNAVLFGLG